VYNLDPKNYVATAAIPGIKLLGVGSSLSSRLVIRLSRKNGLECDIALSQSTGRTKVFVIGISP